MTYEELMNNYQRSRGDMWNPQVSQSQLGMTPEQALPYSSYQGFLAGQARDWGGANLQSGTVVPDNGDYSNFQQPQPSVPAGSQEQLRRTITPDVNSQQSSYMPNQSQAYVDNKGMPTVTQNQPGQQQPLPYNGSASYDPSGGGQASPGGIVDQGEFNPGLVTASNSPDPGMIPGQYSPGFYGDYFNNMNNIATQIGDQYKYQTPLANAAQMNTGAVPQPGAQQFGTSSQLNQLLSGQGFDPSILARLHAGATENIANQGSAQMSQAKRALGQAGLQSSPAGAAIQSDVARQVGNQQNQGYNDIEIGNAQVGNQNRLAGVGFQTQIGMGNMQQANMMALENANRLFSALSQNTQNQQQTNMFNTGNQNNQLMKQAGDVSSFVGNQGSAFGNASLSKQAGADAQNVLNRMNNNQFNANQNQGVNFLNNANRENRYGRAQQILGGAGFNSLNG